MTDRELPVLRIVNVRDLVLHEDCEDRRIQRLRNIIAADGYLKNPPIVAPLPAEGAERYVVLDGANRVSAFLQLEMPHILVQVVHYDEVGLDTWNHLVTGMDDQEFFALLQTIPGLSVEPVDLLTARDLLAARRIMAYMIFRDGTAYALSGMDRSLQAQAELLNQVVDTYKGTGLIFRLKTDDIGQQLEYYGDITALVVFPAFAPADIVNLATNHAKLPTGITRHIIPNRALRCNLPLSALQDDRSTEAKNVWLHDHIKTKLSRKEIRYYQESTFLFDE